MTNQPTNNPTAQDPKGDPGEHESHTGSTIDAESPADKDRASAAQPPSSPEQTTRHTHHHGGDKEPGTTPTQFCADRLRARRHLSGLTSGQLAAIAGLPATTVERIENGSTAPNARQVAALCTVLGCAPVDLAPTGDPAGEYWDALCAALPPLTDAQVTAVATVLNRTPTTPRE